MYLSSLYLEGEYTMTLRSVWLYGLILSLITLSLFVRAFVPGGGFEFIWMACLTGFGGCGVSIAGLFLDHRKLGSVVSLALNAVPLLFIFLTFCFGGADNCIGRFLSLLDGLYLGEARPGRQ